MRTDRHLKEALQRIDGKGYKAYKRIQEAYRFAKDISGIGSMGGDPIGMFIIAKAYYSGNPIKRGYRKAMKWSQRAAKKGNVFALHLMGLMYENGLGVEQSQSKALEHYKFHTSLSDEAHLGHFGLNYWTAAPHFVGLFLC